MPEEFINNIAAAFAKQMNGLAVYSEEHRQQFEAAIKDDIIAVALVIRGIYPEYDIDSFYDRAGYGHPRPWHIDAKEIANDSTS